MDLIGGDEVVRPYAERRRHARAVLGDLVGRIVGADAAIEAVIDALRHAAAAGEEGVSDARERAERGGLQHRLPPDETYFMNMILSENRFVLGPFVRHFSLATWSQSARLYALHQAWSWGSGGGYMRRREFIKIIAGSAVTWPLAARAQQPKKIPRLCFLTFDPGTLLSRPPRFDAFFEGLHDLGYVDGKTIAIDYLSANGSSERFPALAADCLRLKADIIAVSTTPAAQAVKNATRTVPIVMIALSDSVGTGLVDSLARPGGNITGMSMMVPELAAKRLGLLKEAVPGISRVLVLSYLCLLYTSDAADEEDSV